MYLFTVFYLHLNLPPIVFIVLFVFVEINDNVVDGIHRPTIYGIGKR